ncbi:MAG: FAD-dependent oxidoreductase [candidate division Zixibacteria bacterium]|nr:FAD-dependent oxidoreductase [Candidatus Tariuqbacter arcticus]
MAKVVKKKKKGLRTRAFTGGSAVQTSNLRPVNVLKKPPCQNSCPNQTSIREILTTIGQSEKMERTYDESFVDAWNILMEKNPFPAILGRVCPHPCESDCNRQYKEASVGINNIERFIGDYGLEKGLKPTLLSEEKQPEKIAVIGSGPAGMSCAYQLTRLGYKVTVFEAFPKTGGMLRYGIPAYRLPRDIIDAEYHRLEDMGIEIKCNTVVGKDIPLEELRREYDAIFVGIGAHKGKMLGITGEDSARVFTGTGFLNRINSGEKIDVGDNVVVVGGGDTAIDAARVARRIGAKATILYRRTRKEMPAIDEEITGAEEEEVQFHFLAIPVEVNTDGDNRMVLKCQRMELGEPDSSGRRRPIPIEGDYFDLEASTLIAAISQEPEFEGLEKVGNPKDWVKIDEQGQTSVENIYAGGDAFQLGLVSIAIYQGRIAAQTIHSQLRGIEIPKEEELPIIKHDKMLLSYYEEKFLQEAECLTPDTRLKDPEAEIASTLTREQVIEEAMRCMSCGSCFGCDECWSYCQDNAVIKPLIKGEPYKYKMEFCNGCKKCAEQCPCGYIEMH